MTYRSKKYLRFVAGHPCANCGIINETVVPHHEGAGIMGGKISDLRTIPLCFTCHGGRHQKGKLNLDHKNLQIDLIEEWLNEM